MSTGKSDQGRSQQLCERTAHRLDGEKLVTLPPHDERRDATAAQRRAYLLGLPWIEVPWARIRRNPPDSPRYAVSISRNGALAAIRRASTG